ncbi:MAG: hypothetical protein JXQ71_15225 [Verrucomicrobia bacterium]|nr:hypothetical protein [Verrucomicrobiota bacterium]
MFNEIGRAIKAASPFPHTFVLTHGNATGGCLPTRPGHAEAGYEPQSCPFAPGAAERAVEGKTRMLRALRDAGDCRARAGR